MSGNRHLRSQMPAALFVAVALAACAPSLRPGPVTPTVGDRFFVSGYHPYWAGDEWRTYPWEVLDEIYFFELEVGADGRVADAHGWPDAWLPFVERARREGVRVVPTVSQHDAPAFVELFGDPARIARLVDELAALLVATPGLGGLHLDFEVFEPVSADARAGFTTFAAALDARLAEVDPSLLLSTFALAFDDDDVYDEPALAAVSDFLVVQGYDFHSRGEARAGPVAALTGWGRLNWEVVVERFLQLGVSPRKVVMSVPLYGYRWPVTSAAPGADTRGVAVETPLAPAAGVVPELPRAFAEAALHGIRRDPQSGSPYYAFQDSTGWQQGWFEDAESLRAKYAFVREHGLGGVALFPLAYGDATLWPDLRALSRPRR
jgi:spore germination protein YaaH